MIPKRIWLKNFLSFGEPAAEFVFADDEPLWVLCGPNGVGKSAVFDAITYALYGRHRGGKVDAAQLVRHGANGFEIEFDFEFNGADYRIRRTRLRKKGGRTTQHLLKLAGGEWKCVRGNDPAGAVTADDIEKWVTETIGLGYEAFTNSVLLRQGEADKLFSASRDERIAVLKGIIGFEQFEALSERVHAATVGNANKADGLWTQRNDLQPVTDEQLSDAEQAVGNAETARAAAQDLLKEAIERVGLAKQWEKLEKQRTDLERQLAEAEARAKEDQQIRGDKAALDDLTAAVPVLEALFKVRGRLAGLQEKLTAANTTLRVKELARDIKAGERLLLAVAAVETLEAKLKEYPDDLDAQLDAATVAEEAADQGWHEARDAKTRAETRRDEAKQQQEEFADVSVGTLCSRCRQPVGPEHAQMERARLAAEVEAREAACKKATTEEKAAKTAFSIAQGSRNTLKKSKTDRQALATEMKAKKESLPALGEVTTAAELRASLAALRKQKTEAEGHPHAEEDVQEPASTDARRLEAERNRLDGEVQTAQRHGGSAQE